MTRESQDDAKQVDPFMLIERGEDTVDADGSVRFADFSPSRLYEDDEEVSIPKAESAPEPVPSEASTVSTEPSTAAIPAPPPAPWEDGQNKQSDDSKRSSSSDPKSGPNEPPA